MRILLTTRALGYRGTPKVVVDYARMLSNKHEVAIWAWEEGGESEIVLRREGFKVWVGESRFSCACDFKPHVMNMHRAGVYNQHETSILKRFSGLGVKCIETSTFGRVDASIAGYVCASIQISKWDLLQWRAWGGMRVTRGIYCPNPVNVDMLSRASSERIALKRSEWGIGLANAGAKSPFVIGRIGNTSWKDFGPVAVALLNQYDNVFVVHVQDHCNNIPASLAHHPRVRCIRRLVGYRELAEFYSSCDVCVSMSRIGESFGLVNAEAISCETRVFALSSPMHCNAVLEVVAGSRGGTVVVNPREIVRLVGSAIQNPVEFRKDAKAARMHMIEEYSLPVVGSRLEEIFEAVLRDTPMKGWSPPIGSFGALMRLASGSHPIYTRILMRLYYNPLAYIALQWMKRVKNALNSIMN